MTKALFSYEYIWCDDHSYNFHILLTTEEIKPQPAFSTKSKLTLSSWALAEYSYMPEMKLPNLLHHLAALGERST